MTKKNEILVKEGVNHPDINKENLDEEALERLMGWIHNRHFTDNKPIGPMAWKLVKGHLLYHL